jgi:hypothetical protein
MALKFMGLLLWRPELAAATDRAFAEELLTQACEILETPSSSRVRSAHCVEANYADQSQSASLASRLSTF